MLAILIDLQNLFRACEGKIPLDTIMGEITNRTLRCGEIQEIRLFVPNFQSLAPWQVINALQCKYGVEVSVCLTLREATNGTMKDAVDLEVLKWIMNHVHKDIGPDLLVFVTGDSHFVVSANEARRRGKKVEFWFVDSNVSGVIRQQEELRTIKFAPPILPAGENLFLTAVNKLNRQELLDDDDKKRLGMLAMTAEKKIKSIGWWPSTDELSKALSCEWGISSTDSQQIIEALMVLGVARVCPAITTTISIDTTSPLFQWISSSCF